MAAPLPDAPWRSIGLGLSVPDTLPGADTPDDDLCRSCQRSPCCWTAPLMELTVDTVRDLDRVTYWLGFDRLMVLCWRRGSWSLVYRQPCSHLNRETFLCNLHGSPDKPLVCQTYPARQCMYRANLVGQRPGPDVLQIDLKRWLAVLEAVEVDDRGRVSSLPAFEDVSAITGPLDLSDIRAPMPEPRAKLAQLTRSQPIRDESATLGVWQSPCDGCRAPCCEKVLIPFARPKDRAGIDYLAFLLGFEGLRLGIGDADPWVIIVSSRCRHFEPETRQCGVYGKPERPGVCRTYDPWQCEYTGIFDPRRMGDYVVVDAPIYRVLRDTMQLSDAGRVEQWPGRRDVVAEALSHKEALMAGSGS